MRWNAAERWFDVIGETSWVLPGEVGAWREAPHPPIGVGTPKA